MDLNSYEEGQILLIDKPHSWTSFDVVKKLRYVLKVKKIGHAGTLDPLATGLLLIGTGKFTKKLAELQGMDKTYEGTIGLGRTTPSYDLETAFDSERDTSEVTKESVIQAAQHFTGELQQIPPAHSAIQIGGERAYKKARRKEVVKMEPRRVIVHEFEILEIDGSDVRFRVSCSKGTYIRSLAHDLGAHLGVGGYLKVLRRTSIGPYQIEQAHELSGFIDEINSANASGQ